jgi:hypothetical protein
LAGRVEPWRGRFKPTASSVSALSSIVANGRRVLPTSARSPQNRFTVRGEPVSARAHSVHAFAGYC